MTDQKLTGVFIQLPLSGDQIVSIAGWIPGSREELRNEVLPSIFSIIGTPVTGVELDVVGMRTRDMRSIATSAWHYSGDVENYASTYETQFLVRHSEAQAKLAEKGAEIARLREENEALRMAVNTQKRFLEVLMEASLEGGAGWVKS